MTLAFLVVFTALAQVPDAGVADPETASVRSRALNDEGMRLYRAKDYEHALEQFAKATELDPTYALAWYNRAATLALMPPDECGWTTGEMFSHLTRAIELDPKRRDRAKKDKDFAAYRDLPEWKLTVLGLKLPKDAAQILEHAQMSSVSQWGASGNFIGISFLPKGRVIVWTRHMIDDDAGFRIVREEHPGRWRMSGERVRIELDQKLGSTRVFEGAPGNFGPVSFDFPMPLGLQSLGLNGCGDA